MVEAIIELALDLDAAAVPGLRGVAELARLKGARTRTVTVATIWHDTPEGAAASEGVAVEEHRTGHAVAWRLTRMRATADTTWPPGTPCGILARGADAAALRDDWPGPLLPVVAFDATSRTTRLAGGDGALSMTIEQGILRAVAAEMVVCRVVLRGPPAAVLAGAEAAARAAGARVAAGCLAARAMQLARPSPAARRPEPPLLTSSMTVSEAFAHVVAHLAGTLLALAPAAAARDGTEPVHQMRVAMRRLRSAMSLFKGVVECGETSAARAALRELGAVLGPARDWDVFTEETAARLDGFAGNHAVRRLRHAAVRRRMASYAALGAYLASAGFGVLGVRLAGLAAARPWEASAEAGVVPVELPVFAAHRLSRLRRRLLAAGEHIGHLPADELHPLRIRAKRLRYAAEFFTPLFPGKPMLRLTRRISALQAELGVLNDGAVTAKLVGELARAPGYAAGVVAGDVAARAGDARARIKAAWRKVHHTAPAWT